MKGTWLGYLLAAAASRGGRVAAGLALCAAAAGILLLPPADARSHFADADDSALVATGRIVYAANCASCHGRRLQGQALWQLEDEYAGLRAPAHDPTGHTWQHSDEAIYAVTKYGAFPGELPGRRSAMPAFEGRLSDRDILAAIAFIKGRWPLDLRASQAMLNPGFAGMPGDAGGVEWRLPPVCRAVLRRDALLGRDPEDDTAGR